MRGLLLIAAALRVVSLHDVTTEMVVALGGVDRLVGVAPPVDAPPGVAEATHGVAQVEGLESVLAVRPTLVLGLAVVQARDPEPVARLRAAGIEVLLPRLETLDDVTALVRQIGSRLGRMPQAERLVADLQRRAGDATAPTRTAPRVFVYDCCEPPFTAGRHAVLTDLIRRAGGRNVFESLDADWTHVSWEEALAQKPQLVVVHAYLDAGQPDMPAKLEAVRRVFGPVPVLVLPLRSSLGGLASVETVGRLRDALRGLR
jgi:iron complex transport system substrate-binding protein